MTIIQIYKSLAKYIRKNYGLRCKEFVISCTLCQAYVALDIVEDMVETEKFGKKYWKKSVKNRSPVFLK